MTEHKNILAALLAAQPNFTQPEKNAENDHYKTKYADLAAVTEAVKTALNSEGIVFYHLPEMSELGDAMKTILHHPASETELVCTVPLMLAKRDSQGYKAATTYAKRIGLESVTGVAPSDDDDAEDTRKGQFVGSGLGDAWKDSVLDKLPENASPFQKAQAFADAICADFRGKGEKALNNRWAKHEQLIRELNNRFPDLHGQVIDAFERALASATGQATDNAEWAAQ